MDHQVVLLLTVALALEIILGVVLLTLAEALMLTLVVEREEILIIAVEQQRLKSMLFSS